MFELTNHAGEIRRHHDAVKSAAETAITHALAVGKLLTEVREQLPHGKFGEWLSTNCPFTDRTARRYMQLHSHRDTLPAGAGVKVALAHLKTDTVSEMEFMPPPGEARIAFGEFNRYWIIWLAEDSRYAHAVFLDLSPTGPHVDAMKRPIATSHFADQLRYMELQEPEQAEWNPIPLTSALGFRAMAMS